MEPPMETPQQLGARRVKPLFPAGDRETYRCALHAMKLSRAQQAEVASESACLPDW